MIYLMKELTVENKIYKMWSMNWKEIEDVKEIFKVMRSNTNFYKEVEHKLNTIYN